MVNEPDISEFIKNTALDEKTKEDKIPKQQIQDSSLFPGQSYFINDRSQNFLIFQTISKTSKMPTGLRDTVSFQNWDGWIIQNKIRIWRKLLKTRQNSFYSKNIVNLYIVNELDLWSEDLDADFNLKIYLFRTVTLTKIADPNKYSYSWYGIGADFCSLFYFPVLIGVTMLLFLE